MQSTLILTMLGYYSWTAVIDNNSLKEFKFAEQKKESMKKYKLNFILQWKTDMTINSQCSKKDDFFLSK